MHKYQKQAAENIPEGYSRVRSGRILPDDLVWSVYSSEFLPADSDQWLQPTGEWAGPLCYVIRRGAKKPETDNGPEQLLIYAPQQTEFGF